MSHATNAATELTNFCRLADKTTEMLIDEALKDLAQKVEGQQLDILQEIREYRQQLSAMPSEQEFYDLNQLLFGNSKGCDNIGHDLDISSLCVDVGIWNSWMRSECAPPMPMRRHYMLLMLDCYLERNVFNGVGRLSQSIARTGGDDLLSGDWRLTSLNQPAYVEWLPTERWRVADVILPLNVDWYDRVGNNTHLIAPPSYTNLIAELIGDLYVVDLLMPKGGSEQQNLLTRLQKYPGVGSKKAHQIIAWLSDVGCKFLKGGPAKEETLPDTDKVVDYHHDD